MGCPSAESRVSWTPLERSRERERERHVYIENPAGTKQTLKILKQQVHLGGTSLVECLAPIARWTVTSTLWELVAHPPPDGFDRIDNGISKAKCSNLRKDQCMSRWICSHTAPATRCDLATVFTSPNLVVGKGTTIRKGKPCYILQRQKNVELGNSNARRCLTLLTPVPCTAGTYYSVRTFEEKSKL